MKIKNAPSTAEMESALMELVCATWVSRVLTAKSNFVLMNVPIMVNALKMDVFANLDSEVSIAEKDFSRMVK